MFIHRYHLPYYQQVAVFFWPILFFELWRVDRWQDQTGRRAFVTPDKYGRAWVPYFEGMGQKPHLTGIAVEVYSPSLVTNLCPGRFELASASSSENLGAMFSPAQSNKAARNCLAPLTNPKNAACLSLGQSLKPIDPG